ncbi:hypothetical protein E2C01_098991 [Portunus trituberculatus]|uniref:Uncharacterized protein n=1 Tax=Portunus trituberculatus TaxID=210409 RepID=A0A5B7K9T7_PORTR|nr:hypothetical protein [Portunus trituberculatus]
MFSLLDHPSHPFLSPQSIREATRKIQKLNVVGKHEYDLPPDIESKLDDQRLIIRRAETSKVKMECKIEVLKEGGVEVEDYAKSLDSDSLGVEVETSLSRSESTLSVREEVRHRVHCIALCKFVCVHLCLC